MAFKLADGIVETTVSTGAPFVLAGETDGRNPFSSYLADGDTTLVGIKSSDGFETRLMSYNTASNQLEHVEILESSNGGSAVTWPAGVKTIACVLPARRFSLKAPFQGLAFNGMQVNGDHIVSEQYVDTAKTGITGDEFLTDQWRLGVANTSAAFSGQRISSGLSGLPYALRITCTTADASVGATDLVAINHFIEGFRVARLGFGASGARDVTIGMWVRSSITGTFAISIRNATVARSYVSTFTIAVADTWEFKTFTIAGDTSGTWEATSSLGFSVGIALMAGSNFQGTAGAWSGSNIVATSAQTNFAADVSRTFDITGFAVLASEDLTGMSAADLQEIWPLLMRPRDYELPLCQRYWEKSYDRTVVPGTATTNGGAEQFSANGTAHIQPIRFKVAKRIAPTMTFYNPNSGATGSWRDSTGGADITVASQNVGQAGCGVAHTSSVDQSAMLGHWIASARLP